MAEHYFSENPNSHEKIREFEAFIRGIKFRFRSGSSVFSKSGIDAGTKLLAEKCIIRPGWKVLDMGCGYGPIGVMAAYLGADVVMADINRRALQLAAENVLLNGVKAKTVLSNAYEHIADSDFDTILINPPEKAGLEVCIGMVRDAPAHLKTGGFLQIVSRNRVAGKRLSSEMKAAFGNCEEIARRGDFSVYASVKR